MIEWSIYLILLLPAWFLIVLALQEGKSALKKVRHVEQCETSPQYLKISHNSRSAGYFLIMAFTVLVTVLYTHWGAWPAWNLYQQKQAQAEQVQAVMQAFKSPQALIARLKQQLTHRSTAQGWYLLGRLYSSQSQWPLAQQAFHKALSLKPQHQAAQVNEIWALWQLNHQQFNTEIRQKLHALLRQDPTQPDALAWLAMDAYQQKKYSQAIAYWQTLLRLTPRDSEAAKALRKAILRAKAKIS